MSDATHVVHYLREHDRDRYYATLVLPPAPRAAVAALFAFSADCASIRSRISEPGLGGMRLQWWADALSGAADAGVRANPLAAALLDAIAEYRLPAAPLIRLINARRFDLYDDPMPDIAGFEGYAGETASVLFQLAAVAVAGGEPVAAAEAAGHLGVADALVGHLRAYGWNASRGRLFLPLSVFAANGVSEAEIYAGTVSERLEAALTQLREMAQGHIEAAARGIAALPASARPGFATIALLPAQLRTLPSAAKPFAPPAELADWRKIAALWLWVRRQR